MFCKEDTCITVKSRAIFEIIVCGSTIAVCIIYVSPMCSITESSTTY